MYSQNILDIGCPQVCVCASLVWANVVCFWPMATFLLVAQAIRGAFAELNQLLSRTLLKKREPSVAAQPKTCGPCYVQARRARARRTLTIFLQEHQRLCQVYEDISKTLGLVVGLAILHGVTTNINAVFSLCFSFKAISLLCSN